MPHPILYQINTRCWLRDLSEAAGKRITLAKVSEEIMGGWQRLGFTHIWLMGVWTTGPRARRQALSSANLRRQYDEALPGWTEKDVLGSPYAIAACSVPTELGGDNALKKFRQALHRHGLKLILDFVPNHVGIDHPWVVSQPDLFVQSDTSKPDSFIGGSAESPLRLCHGRDPLFDPWTDTAQLDYRRPDTRSMMTLELLQLADRCDGLRCDMAMLVMNDVFNETWKEHLCRVEPETNEFWPDAIAAVREKHPDFTLIAEAYWNREPDLLKLGFDFAYQKTITDAIYDEPEAVQKVVLDGSGWLAGGVHFLENHDERRVASCLDPDPHRAAALALLSLPGMRFLHEGQLEGWRVRTPVQLGRRQREETNPRVRAIYDTLLEVLAKTAIGRGGFDVLKPRSAWEGNPTASSFLLVQWETGPDEFCLVVANLAGHRGQCYAPLSVASLATHDWTLVDLLGDERYVRPGEELQSRGLYLDVPAWAAQVFQFKRPNG